MLEKITQLLLTKKYNLNRNSIFNIRLSFHYQHKSSYAVTISTHRHKTPHFVCNFEAFERGLWHLYHHQQPGGLGTAKQSTTNYQSKSHHLCFAQAVRPKHSSDNNNAHAIACQRADDVYHGERSACEQRSSCRYEYRVQRGHAATAVLLQSTQRIHTAGGAGPPTVPKLHGAAAAAAVSVATDRREHKNS